MKASIIILAYICVILQPLSVASVCLPYLDSTETTPVDADKCGKQYTNSNNSNYIATQPCSSQSCDWQTTMICKENLLYPGDKCKINGDCQSNKCDNGICTGKGQSIECVENIECNPGFFCSQFSDTSKKCAVQKGLDQSCTSDYDCQNDLVCNSKLCKAIFSVKPNDACTSQATSLTSNWNWACESTYCKDSLCANSSNIVSNVNLKTCADDTQCTLSDKSQGLCLCTYDTLGTQKCKVQPGDDLWKDVITYFEDFVKPYLSETQGKCHTERRFSYQCFNDQYGTNQRILDGFQSYDIKRSEAFDINGGSFDGLSSLTFEAFIPTQQKEYQETYFNADCYQYKCSSQALDGSQCVDFNVDTFQIDNQCDDSKYEYCPISSQLEDQSCMKIQSSDIVNQAPGDSCVKDTNCLDGLSCKSGRCSGLKKGSKCEDELDNRCSIGYACINSSLTNQFECLEQLTLSQQCASDYQCQNDYICVGNVCQKYFSIPVNSVANGTCDEVTLNSDICAERQCNQENSEQLMCIRGLASIQSIPEESNFVGSCSADNGLVYNFAEVKCSHGNNKKTYCGAFYGDKPGQNLVKSWKNILGISQGKCHSSRRFDPYCWYNDINDKWSTFKDYYVALYEFENYPQITLSDNCTWSVYWPEYYAMKNDDSYFDYDKDSANLLLASVFAFILLI